MVCIVFCIIGICIGTRWLVLVWIFHFIFRWGFFFFGKIFVISKLSYELWCTSSIGPVHWVQSFFWITFVTYQKKKKKNYWCLGAWFENLISFRIFFFYLLNFMFSCWECGGNGWRMESWSFVFYTIVGLLGRGRKFE